MISKKAQLSRPVLLTVIFTICTKDLFRELYCPYVIINYSYYNVPEIANFVLSVKNSV